MVDKSRFAPVVSRRPVALLHFDYIRGVKSTAIFLLSLIFVSTFFSCTRTNHKGFWQPTGTAADAANDSVEDFWRKSFEVRPDLVVRLDSVSRKTGNPQDRARALFWRSTLELVEGNPVSLLVDSAVNMMDTVRYPYDWARAVVLRPDGEAGNAVMIREAAKAAGIFKQSRDTVNLGLALQRLQYFLYVAGDTMINKRVAREVQDLFMASGNREGVLKCRFDNLVSQYLDPPAGGDSLLVLSDSILAMPEAEVWLEDWERSVLYDARFERTHYKSDLDSAMKYADKENDFTGTRTVSAGHAALWFAGHGDMEEALEWSAVFGRGLADPLGDKRKIYFLAADVFKATGMPDSAAIYRDKADTELYARERAMDSAAAFKPLIPDILESLEGKPVRSGNAWLWISAGVALLLLSATALHYALRSRGKSESESARGNQTEKLHRLTASAIRSALGSEFTDLGVESEFARLAPSFAHELKEAFPDISPAEIRMARLTVIGIGNKQAAILLSITVDSVKKSRNRLRRRLGLGPSDDVEAFLLRFLM